MRLEIGPPFVGAAQPCQQWTNAGDANDEPGSNEWEQARIVDRELGFELIEPRPNPVGGNETGNENESERFNESREGHRHVGVPMPDMAEFVSHDVALKFLISLEQVRGHRDGDAAPTHRHCVRAGIGVVVHPYERHLEIASQLIEGVVIDRFKTRRQPTQAGSGETETNRSEHHGKNAAHPPQIAKQPNPEVKQGRKPSNAEHGTKQGSTQTGDKATDGQWSVTNARLVSILKP